MHISGSRSFFAHVLCAIALTPLVSSMSIPANTGMKRDTCHTGYLRVAVDEAHRALAGSYLGLSCVPNSGQGNGCSAVPPIPVYLSSPENATLLEYCIGSPGTIATADGTSWDSSAKYWVGAIADTNSTNFWSSVQLAMIPSDHSSPTTYTIPSTAPAHYDQDPNAPPSTQGQTWLALTHIFGQPAPNANQGNLVLKWPNERDLYLSQNNGVSLKPATAMTPSVYFDVLQ